MPRRFPARRFTRLDDFGPDARRRHAAAARRRPRRLFLPIGGGAALLAVLLIGSGLVDELTGGRPDVAAATVTASAVRTSFDFCHGSDAANCVVDGDTFHFQGEKVRIAGIDAPETHRSRCAEEAALGRAATERLRDLLSSGAITLTPIDRDRDRYGRLLRNVAVDGRDVGELLVSEGVARPYANGRRSWCG